jgi:hypothetical protein
MELRAGGLRSAERFCGDERDGIQRCSMKKMILLATLFASALPLVGCETPQQQGAANGAVLGGAAGALFGGLATGRPGGALAGAAVGAATGAVVGSASAPRRCVRVGYDYNGNQVCLAYE